MFFLSLNKFDQNVFLSKIEYHKQDIEDSIGYD